MRAAEFAASREMYVSGRLKVPKIAARDGGRESSLLAPSPDQAAQQHKLAEVVGIVIGEEQGFAQDGLTGAVRDGRGKIRSGIHHKFLHLSQVTVERFHAFVPGGGTWRHRSL